MLKFRKFSKLLDDESLFSKYPKMFCDVAKALFAFDYEVPTLMEALKRSKKDVGLLKLLLDGFRVVRSI
jgi:hypothetical protein